MIVIIIIKPINGKIIATPKVIPITLMKLNCNKFNKNGS